jgi:hypothetical protein
MATEKLIAPHREGRWFDKEGFADAQMAQFLEDVARLANQYGVDLRRVAYRDEPNVFTVAQTVPQGQVIGVKDANSAWGTHNFIVNGDLLYEQRGSLAAATSFIEANYYLDMFFANVTGGITADIQAFKDSLLVDGSNAHVARVTITGGGTGVCALRQKIENYLDYRGARLTAYALLKSTKQVSVSFWDGVTSGSASHSGSDQYELIAVPLTVDANPTFLRFGFGFLSGLWNAGDTFDLAYVGFVKGDLLAPHQRRPPLEELPRCQRYYEKSYDVGTNPGTLTQKGMIAFMSSANVTLNNVGYRVNKMPGAQVVNFYSPVTGILGFGHNYTAAADFGMSATASVVGETGWRPNAAVAPPTDNIMAYHWTTEINP